MVRFGVPGQNINTLAYADNRLAVVPVVQAPRRPTVDDKKYPLWTEWRVNKEATAPVSEGEFWKLIKFESNGDATWVRFYDSGTTAGVNDLRDQANTDVTIDPVTGKIDINGSIVANNANPANTPFETVADVANHTLDLQMQLATTVAPTPADSNSAGISSFNSNHFTIDATSGMVSLAGGSSTPAFVKLDVDASAAPGTDPVLATSGGIITLTGSSVIAHSKPVQTVSWAANTCSIDVQLTKAVTPTPLTGAEAGLCCFNTNQFTVEGISGMVSLKGSTSAAPILTLTGSDGGGAISPDGSGNITLASAGGATITGAGNTITINAGASGGGITWREETGTSATFSANEGVFANNAATVTLTLPAAASVGDTFAAYQEGTGKVRIAQNASDQIRFGGSTTTAGAAGYIESLNQGDCVTIVAVDTDRFRVINSTGSWTIA